MLCQRLHGWHTSCYGASCYELILAATSRLDRVDPLLVFAAGFQLASPRIQLYSY